MKNIILLVSILIPFLNTEKYIRKFLGSVISQVYINITVEDESIDNSRTITKKSIKMKDCNQ